MYKFRLQRVLELREKREKEVAGKLAQARGEEEAAQAECRRLEEARDHGVQRACDVQGAQPTVGQLQNLRFLVDRLDVTVQQAHQEAQQAGKQVDQCMAEFTGAFQDRKMLDRLRDRDEEKWRQEQSAADREAMDAIALTGFVRSRTKPEPGK